MNKSSTPSTAAPTTIATPRGVFNSADNFQLFILGSPSQYGHSSAGCLIRFRAGVTRWLSDLTQQFVHFMLKAKGAYSLSKNGFVPAAQFLNLFVKPDSRLLVFSTK